MRLTGLHLLLTYQCNLQCDHCFVWGSPWHTSTMTLNQITKILMQAEDLGTIDWVYFEGGEPFLYYPVLLGATKMAAQKGFRIGIVSNAYWATDLEDSLEWLKPFAGMIDELALSNDLYHGHDQNVENARAAAGKLNIPVGVISIAQPESEAERTEGQLPRGHSRVIYRGRAAEKLVGQASLHPWHEFNDCPYENLQEPQRIHIDPFGNVHICQGISSGNVFQLPLKEICKRYEPENNSIVGPLLVGGPAALVRRYDISHEDNYADACHLCYQARNFLRNRFPDILRPGQMYGEL